MMGRLKLLFPYMLLAFVCAVVILSNLPASHEKAVPESHKIAMCPPCHMEVDPATAIEMEIGGRQYYFCNEACRESFAASHAADSLAAGSGQEANARLIDVVCNMEVNAAWDFRSEHDGRPYFFCTKMCRQFFDENPEHYLTARCLVCEEPLGDRATFTATYLGNPYELCSEEHRAAFKLDPAAYFMHTMWGIPSWLYYGSIALVLIVSFGVFDWITRRGNAGASAAGARIPSRTTSNAGARFLSRAHSRGNPFPRTEPASLLAGYAPKNRHSHAVAPQMTIALPIVALTSTVPMTTTAAFSLGHMREKLCRTARIASDRVDLLTFPLIRAALRSRLFRFALQLAFVAAFLLILAAGLFGNQNPALNIAPILTWTIWWTVLIILIMFAGKAWCYVCPWDAIAGWIERLSFWKKTDDGLTLGLRWPRIIRNISIATILFIGLTWVELGFGVTMMPRITAYLGLAMLLLAVLSAMLFDRKSFCRYGCLVGRVSGLYALFAGVEVRNRNQKTCDGCGTKECVKGSERAYGCPTFLYPGKLQTNTYCIQCMECIQACPHDNLAVNLRPWGSDLIVEGKPRTDEAYLALLMLSITGFHGLTMTSVWKQFTDAIQSGAALGHMAAFSAGMFALMFAPIAVYAVLVALSKWLADGRRPAMLSEAKHGLPLPLRERVGARVTPALSYKDYFVRYAYALLPIALFYHVAHNLQHLLMEGPKVLALASDPFGWNWNLFGTAHWAVPPMISLDKLWLVQVLLVLIGHVYSLWVAQKTSLRLFGASKAAFRSQLPMLIGMICFSVFSLWLLKQPMEMRTSAM